MAAVVLSSRSLPSLTPPTCHDDVGDPHTDAVLVWRFDTPRSMLSSAPVRGGSSNASAVINIGVTAGYGRHDLAAHADEVASRLGIGAPVALLTAADVRRVVRTTDGGVAVDATVGITKPTWAADADGTFQRRHDGAWVPGTINVVVQVPVVLSPAAMVNAVITSTEAKSQALFEAGIPGTGTASDAVVVVCPQRSATGTAPSDHDGEPFAGPRSTWGARIARATHAAVTEGWRVHP